MASRQHMANTRQTRALNIDYDTVHQIAAGFEQALRDELRYRGSVVTGQVESLLFSRGQPGPAAWAQNSWLAPREYAIDSIGAAARQLAAIQRNWYLHSVACHRRARLIADKLAPIRFKPRAFPATIPTAPLGVFCLLDRYCLLASPTCASPFANGLPDFVEDRQGPPNRAYLKLWEALTLARQQPGPGDFCLDLGAAPGGWSWVLAQLGADVLAVDRAQLVPELMQHQHVQLQTGDAFQWQLADLPRQPDWLVCDIIAYPQRLLELARYWATACPQTHIIMTIKFQGRADPALMSQFLQIPGSGLLHLSANKHELTFFRLAGGSPPEAITGDCPGYLAARQGVDPG